MVATSFRTGWVASEALDRVPIEGVVAEHRYGRSSADDAILIDPSPHAGRARHFRERNSARLRMTPMKSHPMSTLEAAGVSYVPLRSRYLTRRVEGCRLERMRPKAGLDQCWDLLR